MSSLLNVIKTNYILLMQIFITSLQLNISFTVWDNNNYHKFCTSQILKLHQNSLTHSGVTESKKGGALRLEKGTF